MRSFLLSLNGKNQIIFIIGITIFLAFAIAIGCSMFFDVRQLASNTDLISSIYEVMGTLYAILLTFTLWGVWQNFTEVGASVQNEAYTLLNLVHIVETSSSWNNESNSHTIRNVAIDYSTLVIEKEWPTLKHIATNALNIHESSRSSAVKILRTIQTLNPQNERDNIIFGQILTLLNAWLDARRTRILMAKGNSAKTLWPLIFTGAFVLFAIHGLFVAKTLGIWITLLFGTSLVIGLTFYLIFALDCPFEGSLSIDSEPFNLVINILSSDIK